MKKTTLFNLSKTFTIASFSFLALGASAPDMPVDANIFVKLSKKIVPSVVNISTFSTIKNPNGGPGAGGMGSPDDLFKNFFEDFLRKHGRGGGNGGGGGDEEDESSQNPPTTPNPNQKLPRAISLGTGFIIDASGLILTNNHVVAGADEIKITFTEQADEEPTTGEVVGRDPEIDVALIKVKTKRELVPVALGDSDLLDVGEYVIAVGNPFGQGHSVTHGIISAKGRLAPDFPLANYLQTDAPINPGNSGGPLVNLKGEVIGINNAIEQRAQGIGFAIPITLIKKVLPQLRTKGIVERGYIGVLVNEMTPNLAAKFELPKNVKSPFVVNVYSGEPADKAGLKTYDVILSFDGKPVHSSAELVNAVTAVPVGSTVPIKVSRAGKEMELQIKIAQRKSRDQMDETSEPKKNTKKKGKKPAHLEVGMQLEDLTPSNAKDLGMKEKSTGVVVSSVSYGGLADRAGLMRGDVILEADRKPVKDSESFFSVVKEKKSYLLRVRRLDPQGGEAFNVIILDLKE